MPASSSPRKKKGKKKKLPIICVFCTEPALMGETRTKKKPYISCANCGTNHFLNTPKSQAGYEILTEIILMNIEPHREILMERFREKVLEEQARRERASKEDAKSRKQNRKR